jgi:high affinity Mn2+ porin
MRSRTTNARFSTAVCFRFLPMLLVFSGFGCQSIDMRRLAEPSTTSEKSASETDAQNDKSAKPNDKPPAPTTLPQALHAYVQRVREVKYGTPKSADDKAKEKDDSGKQDDKPDKKNDKSASEKDAKTPGSGKKETEKGQEQAPARPDSPGETTPKKDDGKKETEKGKQPDSAKSEAGAGGEGPKKSDDDKKPTELGDKKNGANTKADSDKKKEDIATWYSAHAQATMVLEAHDQFPSPYEGQNSLRSKDIDPTSLTATLFLDTRLWHGGDFVFNPELAGGLGFSNTMGMAGFPNGEITRIGLPQPTPYFARAFFRQTFGMGGGEETVEDGVNQIAGKRDVDRFTISVGKMAASDFFDDNLYSHDPRRQFLNWSLMYDGAWDYPANVRGYTYGYVTELNHESWALRYGAFAEPLVANGAEFDPHFLKANGQIIELEKRYKCFDRPGKVHLDAFLNHAHMGNYSEAIAEMPFSPQIADTRAYRFKYGYTANIEQEITDDLGFFGRAGWNDGHSESWAFTEIDRSISFGFALKGRRWARPEDVCGIGYVCNGLSESHRDYLAHGGYGFIIGDGALNYGHEQILETYYCASVSKNIFITGDFQEALNPAYNRDRGPVSIFTLRVHLEM